MKVITARAGMKAILADIDSVDFEKALAIFRVDAEDKFVAGKYWLVPAPNDAATELTIEEA